MKPIRPFTRDQLMGAFRCPYCNLSMLECACQFYGGTMKVNIIYDESNPFPRVTDADTGKDIYIRGLSLNIHGHETPTCLLEVEVAKIDFTTKEIM